MVPANANAEDEMLKRVQHDKRRYVIPDLIRNPVFSTGFPLESTPYLIRGGNDGLVTNVKKR